MVNEKTAWETARKATRKALEATYEGVCTIIERQDVRDEVTKITQKTEAVVFENMPCRVSFETLQVAALGETAASVVQNVKLFLSPEVVIPSGSKIRVEQDGECTVYAASGVPAVYPTHQELMLELFKEWS